VTSRTIRGGPDAKFPGELTSIVISCDHLGCDKSANDTDIRDQGGLKAMGWQAVPIDGTVRHYCPDHNR
jgi:hypothetical protein